MMLNKIIDNNREMIDKTITTYFTGPKSYTGEDMVEISFHGSNAVIKKFIKDFAKNKAPTLSRVESSTPTAAPHNNLPCTSRAALGKFCFFQEK